MNLLWEWRPVLYYRNRGLLKSSEFPLQYRFRPPLFFHIAFRTQIFSASNLHPSCPLQNLETAAILLHESAQRLRHARLGFLNDIWGRLSVSKLSVRNNGISSHSSIYEKSSPHR